MKKTYAISISQSCLLTNQGEKKKKKAKQVCFFFFLSRLKLSI